MKIAIITINNPSLNAAKKLLPYLQKYECHIFNKSQDTQELGAKFHIFSKVDDILPTAWREFDALLFLMATGAVIRKIAPYLQDKATDPAILIMTLDLKRVIPLVSGHLGGANELASFLAKNIDGCVNFVTTASDQINLLAFDMFAKKYDFAISNLKALAKISNTIINKKQVQVITYPKIIKLIKNFQGYQEENFYFVSPDNLQNVSHTLPTLYITPQKLANDDLQLHPKKIVLGVGMNRDTSKEEIANSIQRFLLEHSLEFAQIAKLASFDAKSDELGLLAYAKESKIPLEFFDKEAINALENEFSPSQATRFFNIKGVAEPASLLASEYKTLFLSKRIYGNVTIAASF